MSVENEDASCCCASCGAVEDDDIKLMPCNGCDLVRYCGEACQELHRPEHAGKCRKRAAELREELSLMTSCCASCGVAEVDDIKLLKECDNCDLVRYCSDECQRDHWSQHEEACKKRAAELRDELLFRQPESSYLGDCPICCLPIPLDKSKSGAQACCSKRICNGCHHANQKRELRARCVQKCPFCREPLPTTEEEGDKLNMKRIEANDPFAIYQQGAAQYMKGDYHGAFDNYTKAAALGDVEAQYQLSVLYDEGKGVEKDEGKRIQLLEEAAIGGHPTARWNLGCHENNNGNAERAVKHLRIAATQGDDDSMKALMSFFRIGRVSKEDLAATLRAKKAAVDATKSPQRKEAEELSNIYRKFLEGSQQSEAFSF